MIAPAPSLTVVLVHGAWADGSSWAPVITALRRAGIAVSAATDHPRVGRRLGTPRALTLIHEAAQHVATVSGEVGR